MKYVDVRVTFAEVPDEISLCLSISGCPIHCPSCHSKYLWEDVGTELTFEGLEELLEKNQGISCVCFCGGDGNLPDLLECLQYLKKTHPDLSTAWYSGRDVVPVQILMLLDFVKTGPFIKEQGPLTQKTTNQAFFRVIHNGFSYFLENLTDRFWTSEE